MKGYKVFNPDWTCQKKQYAVGKVATQDGKLEMCVNGIHFCTKLADCFCYYNADPANKFAEVKAIGDVLRSDEDSKCCTNRLKVVRELSIAELLKDKDFCLEVVKQNSFQVRFMKGQNYEVFLEAVKKCCWTLEYVPEAMKTPEICLVAIKQNGWMLKYVPEELKTPELCLIAVQQNGWILKYIPERLRTSEIYLAAIRQDPDVVCYVKDDELRAQITGKRTDA